jgi:hypothetical protein
MELLVYYVQIIHLQILKANEILADVFISQGRVLENVKILNRVFLAFFTFFFGVLPIKRFILGLFCFAFSPKLSTFFLLLTFLAKF